jgi:hypothetical protein
MGCTLNLLKISKHVKPHDQIIFFGQNHRYRLLMQIISAKIMPPKPDKFLLYYSQLNRKSTDGYDE